MSSRAIVEGIPVPLANPDSQYRLVPGQHPLAPGDKTGPPTSRFRLRVAAEVWRALQYIGICVHFLAAPRPPSPSFTRIVPSVIAKEVGHFGISVYTPEGYAGARSARRGRGFPVVVNFHGGGFTLGSGTDDARFGRFVLERCGAVFVSVDYRLAPEYPFPTAVDDGADALLYLILNAAELHIDPHRIATSGFSAGGNLAITTPLRLHSFLAENKAPTPEHRVVAVASWYPITDYTITRASRRARAKRPDRALPPILTDLFDASYIHPAGLDLANPHLSPAQATDELLVAGLPGDIIMYTCEWDMLLHEGEEFAGRLAGAGVGKRVSYRMMKEVSHGWDKGPYPFSPAAGSEEAYAECCDHLRRVFEGGLV
ncbi:alpha/beta hydrolase [Candidatus Bathyarchaeota archaeon]|nr:alpha/beta hydrolase [Candidatus Bathyarchaeota archaeon]